ncbi:hypothetical protein ABT061_46900 [Streptosporangium sp. NPDC002544]|uniref:hypothetical protein n=1 Tax=Streptosporangium sp. NPDC002544 TaxID=3154538 RepID=UPI0033288C80
MPTDHERAGGDRVADGRGPPRPLGDQGVGLSRRTVPHRGRVPAVQELNLA